MGELFLGIIAAAIVVVLVDWLLQKILPEKPKRIHIVAVIIGIIVLGIVAARGEWFAATVGNNEAELTPEPSQGYVIEANDLEVILSNITEADGSIENSIEIWSQTKPVGPWWIYLSENSGNEDGTKDPTATPGYDGCFGVAWQTEQFPREVIVFEKPQTLNFLPGGWYIQVCAEGVVVSPEYVGQIQAFHLDKRWPLSDGTERAVKVISN